METEEIKLNKKSVKNEGIEFDGLPGQSSFDDLKGIKPNINGN